jgi:hypothetical protein
VLLFWLHKARLALRLARRCWKDFGEVDGGHDALAVGASLKKELDRAKPNSPSERIPVSQLERVAPALLAHSLTDIASDRTNGQWKFFAAWRKGTRKIPRLKKSI